MIRALSWTSIYWQLSTSLLEVYISPGRKRCQQDSRILAIHVRPTKTSHNTSKRVEKEFCLIFESKSTTFLALVKPNRVKSCPRKSASSGALRGRLRRDPLTSRGWTDGRGFAATNFTGWIQAPDCLLLARELPGHSPDNDTTMMP